MHGPHYSYLLINIVIALSLKHSGTVPILTYIVLFLFNF